MLGAASAVLSSAVLSQQTVQSSPVGEELREGEGRPTPTPTRQSHTPIQSNKFDGRFHMHSVGLYDMMLDSRMRTALD